MADTPDVAAFIARCDPNTVKRLDEPPAGAIGRSLTCKGSRPLPPAWSAFATANVADAACAGVPLGMTITRADKDTDLTTTITVWWAA